MNFCPHCGASLPGGAVSFCPNCGNALPHDEAVPPMDKKDASRHQKSRNTPRPRKKQTKHGTQTSRKSHPPKNPMDANYDGYYDDVAPIDAGWDAGGLDVELIKRVALLVLAAVCVIVLAIVLMKML